MALFPHERRRLNAAIRNAGRRRRRRPAAATPPLCPACGAPLEIDPACVVEEPTMTPGSLLGGPYGRRTRVVPAALCTGCEFCLEIIR